MLKLIDNLKDIHEAIEAKNIKIEKKYIHLDDFGFYLYRSNSNIRSYADSHVEIFLGKTKKQALDKIKITSKAGLDIDSIYDNLQILLKIKAEIISKNYKDMIESYYYFYDENGYCVRYNFDFFKLGNIIEEAEKTLMDNVDYFNNEVSTHTMEII